MIIANYFNQPMDKKQAIRVINTWRKSNKGKWIAFGLSVNGTDYTLKVFDLYIQRLTNQTTGLYDSIDAQSVKDFNTFLDSQIA